MREPKTKVNEANVEEFLRGIADEKQRAESFRVKALMDEVTGEPARMWGSKMVGYGTYRYQGKSCAGEWFITGFSPGKGQLSLHLMPGMHIQGGLLEKLGKVKTGQACVYIKNLDDVDLDVLREMVRTSYEYMNQTYNQKGD